MLEVRYIDIDGGVKVISPPAIRLEPATRSVTIIPAQLTIQHTLDTRNWFQKILDAWQPLEWTIWVLAKILLPHRETQTWATKKVT